LEVWDPVADIHRVLLDGTEEPRSPGNPSLQGEAHGDAEHPSQVLFKVRDIPPEGLSRSTRMSESLSGPCSPQA